MEYKARLTDQSKPWMTKHEIPNMIVASTDKINFNHDRAINSE